MGLAMAIFAPMAVFTTKERVRLCGVLGILVAVLSPLVSMTGGDSLPWLAKAYFVPSFNAFGFFPWAAFLAFGMAAGSILRVTGKEELQRTMQWAMLLGIVLIIGGQYFSNLPYSHLHEIGLLAGQPWPNGHQAGRVVDNCGHRVPLGDHGRIALEPVSASLAAPPCWCTGFILSWCMAGGSAPGKDSLGILQVVVFAVVLIITMTGLSMLRTNWQSVRAFFSPGPLPAPDPASGD